MIVQNSSRSQREKLTSVDKKREETKHRTEWCVTAGKISVHEMGKRQ